MYFKTFVDRIESGKSNHLMDKSDGKERLVSVWKHGELYILTWEECLTGDQYNESSYTRDERHKFGTLEQLVDYLREHDMRPELFKP